MDWIVALLPAVLFVRSFLMRALLIFIRRFLPRSRFLDVVEWFLGGSWWFWLLGCALSSKFHKIGYRKVQGWKPCPSCQIGQRFPKVWKNDCGQLMHAILVRCLDPRLLLSRHDKANTHPWDQWILSKAEAYRSVSKSLQIKWAPGMLNGNAFLRVCINHGGFKVAVGQ